MRGLVLFLILLLATPMASATTVCATAGNCATHDAGTAGAGSCDSTSSSYGKWSLTDVTFAAQGWSGRVVLLQRCDRLHEAGSGTTTSSRTTSADATTRQPDGFERSVAIGWYSRTVTSPYGSAADCDTWTQTRNLNQAGVDHDRYGCPAGHPPATLLP